MELARPITIFWDLPGEATDTPLLQRIAAEIMACRPLMLQLQVGGKFRSADLAPLLAQFKGASLAVSLTVLKEMFVDQSSRELLAGVKELLLACDSLATVRDVSAAGGMNWDKGDGAGSVTLGLSFAVTRENWQELPELLAFCREQRIKRLVLPMQRLYNGGEAFYLSRQEQAELTGKLAAVAPLAGVNSTIHDPFLWRAFHPGVPFPQGGCQAANTMLAIDPDGGIFPCPSLPVRLGDLKVTSLSEVVCSPAKKEFRKELLQHPAACGNCAELAECRGGCRGRAYACFTSIDEIDPACGRDDLPRC